MPWFTHIWDVNLETSPSWQWKSTIVPYDLNQDARSTTNNESRHDHAWIYRVIVDIWPWVRYCRWMISLSGCFNDSVKLQHTSSPSKVSTWWLVEYPSLYIVPSPYAMYCRLPGYLIIQLSIKGNTTMHDDISIRRHAYYYHTHHDHHASLISSSTTHCLHH